MQICQTYACVIASFPRYIGQVESGLKDVDPTAARMLEAAVDTYVKTLVEASIVYGNDAICAFVVFLDASPAFLDPTQRERRGKKRKIRKERREGRKEREVVCRPAS